MKNKFKLGDDFSIEYRSKDLIIQINKNGVWFNGKQMIEGKLELIKVNKKI